MEGEEPEERYIDFVFNVFKRFIESEGDRYIGADFDKPEYLKSEGFEINRELIDDMEVVSIIDDEEVYTDILQMILNSFRKFKRKPHGFFTEGLIQQFNMLVEDIASYINAKRKDVVSESLGLPTFVKFKKIGSRFNPILNSDETYMGDSSFLNEDTDEAYDNPLFESDNESKETNIENTSEFFSFKDFNFIKYCFQMSHTSVTLVWLYSY
jgi:hypothetical protein